MHGECKDLIHPLDKDPLSHSDLIFIKFEQIKKYFFIDMNQQLSYYYILLNPRCTNCRMESTMRSRR